MNSIKENLFELQKKIQQAANLCQRDYKEIKLVAVTKTFHADIVRKALNCGVKCLGENYIQEAREKIENLSDLQASWHFIGHLQKNKAKYAVKLFDLIHSVDSFKLAQTLDKEAQKINKIQDILIQINIGNEKTKSGICKNDIFDLIFNISKLSNIKINGLMIVPPYYNNPEKVRPFFQELNSLKQEIVKKDFPNVLMNELSMGMTGDFECAIQEGATLIRIGTAIFGQRK